MVSHELAETARLLVASGRGLLAMDESNPICDKRFAKVGIPRTEAARRSYRELLITTPGLGTCISGAILFEDTLAQRKPDGTPFAKLLVDAGIMPGVKVDAGTKPLALHPGEKITEGLDGLRGRLQDYVDLGARFAKWRAMILIGDGLPRRSCIDANAHAIARFAALCQEAGLVPIVEPEVLMDGDHTLERCREVTEATLRSVFNQLSLQKVMLEGMILRSNMILPGLQCPTEEPLGVIAEATVESMLRVVPGAVPGIAFLSGGQPGELASARLNEINLVANRPSMRLPWRLTFSFGRAIQFPVLEIWRGNPANRTAAQQALYHRAACNLAALTGQYSSAMETEQSRSVAA